MKTLEYFQKNRSLYYIALLTLVTVVLLTKRITHGDFWFSDDARHAMDGVFILDFIRDFPVFNSYDYITQYYTKYPALGIGVYPPLFALVEAIFFGLFGISVTTAKITILFFAVIALIYWFRLIRLIFDEKIAFYSTLLLITTPLIVEWSRAVMLEIPTLALIIMSVYFFYGFIELKKPRQGYYLIMSTVAAIYTKQTAIFLIPVFFFYMIFSKKHKMLISKNVIMICLSLFALVLPLAIVTFKYGSSNISQVVDIRPFNEPLLELLYYHWTYYPVSFFSNNKPLLLLSIFTFFLLMKRKRLHKIVLFLAWILGFYLLFSYIASKDLRYFCYCLPPFTLFSALIINEIPYRLRKVSPASILLICLCIYQFVISLNLYNPSISGYEEAAQYIMKNKEDTVFFQGTGVGTGSFVFNIRQLDTERKMVVFLGDKILASSALYPNHTLVEHVKDRDDVYSLLKAYGSKYYVIDEFADYNINAYKMLRDVLASGNYTLVKKIDKKTSKEKLKGAILIYKLDEEHTKAHTYLQNPLPEVGPDSEKLKRNVIHMRLPIVGTEITVPLGNLHNFYTPSVEAITKP